MWATCWLRGGRWKIATCYGLACGSKALGCALSFYHVALGSLPPLYVPIVIFSDLVYLPPFYLIARRLDILAQARAAESADCP